MQSARSHPRGQDDFRGLGEARVKVPGISYTGNASPGAMNGGATGQVRCRRGHNLKAKGLNQFDKGLLTGLVLSYHQFLATSCVSGTKCLKLPSHLVLIVTARDRGRHPHAAGGRTKAQDGWVTRLGPGSWWKGRALTQSRTLPSASPSPASRFSSTYRGLAVLIETALIPRSASETLTEVTHGVSQVSKKPDTHLSLVIHYRASTLP